MILGSLENTERYEVLNPLFKQAFEFVKNTDFSKFEDGKYEIDGTRLFVNINSLFGKDKKAATIEVHQKYIDIQFPISGIEKMGWKPFNELQEVSSPYNEEKDIAFYADRPTAFTKVYPGQFVIFFPDDGHAPGIGEGAIRKAIIKVAVE